MCIRECAWPIPRFGAVLEYGAVAFPVPVHVADGHLFVAPPIQTSSALCPGDEIVAVNGQAVSSMIAELTPLMRGESGELRERLLSLWLLP